MYYSCEEGWRRWTAGFGQETQRSSKLRYGNINTYGSDSGFPSEIPVNHSNYKCHKGTSNEVKQHLSNNELLYGTTYFISIGLEDRNEPFHKDPKKYHCLTAVDS
ncbi:hypothetical protein LOAG_03268 [Loa loa]|uniref:Uncharacterized protein n=1 Tax=Loa loa TaxID=7209 RepID=A0A1S0U4W5_LOALO|nr:hypothetical protein LOAG_03268 [Loa loa]EFO25218.1 hypothetical protein LOAG_03268 [Loa loa]